MAVAMFRNSLDAASADKSVWDLALTSLEKAFVLARKLGAKLAYQPKSGVLAHLLVSKPTQAKPSAAKPLKTLAINVMCCAHQAPSWPTSTGSLPVFAASAAIPEVSSYDPAVSILTLQNKEDIFYFLFTATFYTRFCQAKATVLVDMGAAGNFMDLSLAQSLGLSLLPPKSLIASSKVLVLSYHLTNPLSYCTGSHVFVSKFSAVEDLLYPVIMGVGWWRRHLVQIDCLTNKLHFLLDRSPGSFPLLLLGWKPPESCLSFAATPVSPPEPFALPAILALFKDDFDATLSCALPPLLS
ncbi:Retrotransposon-derived protein peg10 [Entomophthora muscae]|uniref:Retrotransposon-derived protein peg10 n=1 Tax=Entomophthora muscae TaxID=34485 RepID=A0ACC2TZN4_9FUNG|nr:Retrotransposon-derived protein peg10 [Entomophthora muscae]